MITIPERGRRLLAAALVLPVLALTPGSPDVPSDDCGPLLEKPGGGTWSCSFVDEFDGTRLDAEKWVTQDTARTGFRTGLTCYRGDSNVAVRSGTLLLEARREGAMLDCDNPYGAFRTPYTGGLVGTRGHLDQTYGRFEIRAKWPTATTAGVHGAFWLYPLTHTYGPWPASGEIDVAEWWSSKPDLVLPSLHYPGESFWTDSGWNCRVADATLFHTYTLEWSPTEMVFFIDGTPCFRRTWTPSSPLVAPQPFDQPFSIVLNMGVGETTGTNIVSHQTELPATFTIDYAKAWR